MKEWYLITPNSRPNMTGGYENQGFDDWRGDAFLESLSSEIADTVTIYSSDLKKAQVVRCIIQGNTADTQLNSLERTILFPIGTIKAGMYVYFENCYWLVTGYPGNNKIYEKVTVILCQYHLRWQNAAGKIIERWVNLTSAAKYDVGETATKTIILATNNYTVLIPNDNETMHLEGKRVFIDQLKVNPIKVFKITRCDDSFYTYGEHGAVLSLIADRTEMKPEIDNQELRLCDYISPTLPPHHPNQSNILSRIEGRTDLKVGSPRKYMVSFIDENRNKVSPDEVEFRWNIDAEFWDKITWSADSDVIELQVDDTDLIDEKFRLQIIIDDKVNSEITITVSDVY